MRKISTNAPPPSRKISAVSRKISRQQQPDEYYDPSQLTYVYDTKNANLVTREALPKLDHYRDLESVGYGDLRPTMEELHAGSFVGDKKPPEEEDDNPTLKGKVIKFGWLEGVLMRCLLNIWGVILFIRLSWVIGQTGILEGLLLITFANVTTFITAVSMSAVSTNGQIKGGGIYYMISRSLGPEFGAAIGLMFTIANSMGVSLHLVGFCENLNDMLRANNWGQIIDGGSNDIRVVGIAALIFILILAFVGMDWVTRTQMFLLLVLIAAQVNFIVGSFIGPVDNLEKAQGFIGYDSATFKTNLYSEYRTGYGTSTPQNFNTVFGVFFPAVTGIVAGANLSGDLKDPGSAIPKGTLLAIIITYIGYFFYVFMIGGCALREASGDVNEYLCSVGNTTGMNCTGVRDYTDCEGRVCGYGLYNSAQVMELISSWGPLIYMGCFAATLSSAIASLVGAPRVFQALCKDKLYPGIEYFAKGYGANNDPVRGYILVFILSTACLLIAEVNAIAPLVSNFFLMAYVLINFSVFHASMSNSPGWRPSFKYYNKWVSLLGCALGLLAMFLMSWPIALGTVGCVVLLYVFVSYRKLDVNWGSSTQAQSYQSALKSVQDLNNVEEHVKNYRPQLLLLGGFPAGRPALVDFGYLLVKNMSLMVVGDVVKSCPYKTHQLLNKEAYAYLSRHKIKAFYNVVENRSFLDGVKSMMQNTGLGKLRPNMVLVGWKGDWMETNDDVGLREYFGVIHESLDMHLSLGILRVNGGFDYSKELGLVKEEENNDTIQEVNTTDDEGLQEPEEPEPEVKPKKSRKKSLSNLYMKQDGTKPPAEIISKITMFRKIKDPKKPMTIDVWWLYDDGGLTMLLPYILSNRNVFGGATSLRVFTLAKNKGDLDREQRSMASLLSKFRIAYSDVIVITDITKKAAEGTKQEFNELIAKFRGKEIKDSELVAMKEKTNRNLRLREVVGEHTMSGTTGLVVMTLPVPRKTQVSAQLYMAWLEMISRGVGDDVPFLFVRGNQTSVLTYYS